MCALWLEEIVQIKRQVLKKNNSKNISWGLRLFPMKKQDLCAG